MLQWIQTANSFVNNLVWGLPAMVCIIGVGLLLTLRTRFLQFRKLPHSINATVGKLFSKEKAGAGSLTPFQALCTALAATVGTGNIAGVAGAIAIGGPGAVFWMWVSALLGMCTKFAEVTLAVNFRERNAQGEWVGGPMYYIKNGLPKRWHWLATLYCAFGMFAVFGIGNTTQVNSITTSVNTVLTGFNLITPTGTVILNWIIGIAVVVLLFLVLLGGLKRIGSVTEKLVPFMALLYVVLGLGVVILNIDAVPGVLADIVKSAFSPSAVTGGVVGSFFIAMQKGFARGIFSNEAGLGTGSIAHACADTQNPVKQGYFGVFEVFVDTIVICTLTALTILCSGTPVTYGAAAGAELTISGFVATYGSWVSPVAAIAMCCFAFSTVIGWALYGARCAEYLFSSKVIKPYMAVFAVVAFSGAVTDLGILWDLSDTFNGLMSIPNLIALFLLSGTVVKLIREYQDK